MESFLQSPRGVRIACIAFGKSSIVRGRKSTDSGGLSVERQTSARAKSPLHLYSIHENCVIFRQKLLKEPKKIGEKEKLRTRFTKLRIGIFLSRKKHGEKRPIGKRVGKTYNKSRKINENRLQFAQEYGNIYRKLRVFSQSARTRKPDRTQDERRIGDRSERAERAESVLRKKRGDFL